MISSGTRSRVTVFIVRKIGEVWHPIVERHRGCHGVTHDTCSVERRLVGYDPKTCAGFKDRESADSALEEIAKTWSWSKP